MNNKIIIKQVINNSGILLYEVYYSNKKTEIIYNHIQTYLDQKADENNIKILNINLIDFQGNKFYNFKKDIGMCGIKIKIIHNEKTSN